MGEAKVQVEINPQNQELSDRSHDNVDDYSTQAGVRQVEAMATVWSRRTLLTIYALIWLVYFVMLMQQASTAALNPFVTSAFQLHSLTPTVQIVSGVIGGVCNLTVAKILDVFGRPHGYAASIVVSTTGLILMAATSSVEMYAAAQVFWTVGNAALLYTINIIVADTSTLRTRALMTALTSSPNMATIWIGGPIAEAFLKGPGWAWCFGTFAIVVPIACLPLLVVLVINYVKANRQGVFTPDSTPRSPWRQFLYYAREFDAIGILLLSGGLVMVLLPFNLWGLQPQGWKSPLIICLLVFGVALVVIFAVWERYFAPVTFIPYSLLLSRNMVGTILLCIALFVSYSSWISFFSSFLLVVNDLTVTQASYIIQGYSLGSSIFTIVTGVFILYHGRYKLVTLYGAVPVYTLFTGLLIYFRKPEMDIGYIVMCQLFLAFSSGILIITPQIASMAAASHQHIAVIIAIISMFSSVGSAVGSTIAGAIWQSVFPASLAEYLPAEDLPNLLTIYGSVEAQLAYPVGSPGRIAIQRAYGDAQAMMLTAATAVWVIGFVGAALWRDIDVRNIKQVKGQVL